MEVSRNFANNAEVIDQLNMARRFENMLDKVDNMIKANGAIYSTWIKFQVGKSKPIIFDSSSTNQKQNLIASLNMQKSGAGVANTFTLDVRYDPFNYGQNTSDKIEALDELLGEALRSEFDDDNEALRGYIQYGYNYTQDNDMVSPKYQYILTNVSSSVEWSSGMTTYTFEGTSEISTDCDFTTTYDQINAEMNWGRITYLTWILYYYYGDPEHTPSHIKSGEKVFSSNGLKYRIDIPDALYDTEEKNIVVDAQSELSPWVYCKSLIQNKMSQSDMDSDKYTDYMKLDPAERPQYIMYITDNEGVKTIHVNYVSPKVEDANIHINYDFTWSQQSRNIIQKWQPEVNLYVYLIQKQRKVRADAEVAVNLSDPLLEYEDPRGAIVRLGTSDLMRSNKVQATQSRDAILKEEALTTYTKKVGEISSDYLEAYNASITTIGIPADVPIGATIAVKPVILESVSRTAGKYIIKEARDTISTQGIFFTDLKLFRIGNL